MEKMMNNFAEAIEEPTIEQLKDYEDISEQLEVTEEEDGPCESSVKIFLREIKAIDLLTREEEIRLAKQIKEGGEKGKAAREKLVSANLRLVFYHAKKYMGRGLDFEDLIGLGNEGLLKAVDKYDYSKEVRFATYASFWIKEAISRGVLNDRGTIRVPAYLGDAGNRIRKVQEMLRSELGTEPSVEDIAAYAELPISRVRAALNMNRKILSFEAKFSEDKDGTVEDTIADERAVDPCEEVIKEELKGAVSEILQKLEPREALVLRLRFGIGYDRTYTLEEIGTMPEMGITRERVRQIQDKALGKIKRNGLMRNKLIEFAS